jgi:hypothetical protein
MSTRTELTLQYEMLAQWGALIAELPIEQWISDLEYMDTIGPIIDPTLYRAYIYSGKKEPLLEMLRGALAFKQGVLRARRHVIDNPRTRHVAPRTANDADGAEPNRAGGKENA